MLQHYVHAFSSLRTDTSKSRWSELTRHHAPHKPLLLLAVIDMYAEGRVTWNTVHPEPELAELFALYWLRIMPPHQRGIMALPFFHLQSDGFWHLKPQPGQAEILAATRQIRSFSELVEKVYGARVDEALSELLQDELARETLRMTLIDTYFAAAVQPLLREQGEINVGAYYRSEELLSEAREGVVKEEDEFDLGDPVETAVMIATRGQAFRRAIVIAYNHRCAFCGIRIVSAESHTALEAAHIIPWSLSRNDLPTNGLGLCRLCHWAFDEGLLSMGRTFHVLVSPQLVREPNAPGHLAALQYHPMTLPADVALHPAAESVEYHHKVVYRHR
jgi:putative restriction endonuclease